MAKSGHRRVRHEAGKALQRFGRHRKVSCFRVLSLVASCSLQRAPAQDV